MIYRFDAFEVDDREFRLSEGGTPVPLEPKALRLLIVLIENRSRLARKQELLDKVWPDAMVTENALTRAIRLLRKALHDDIRVPRYIETVPTAGYRFIAQITTGEENTEEESPAAAKTEVEKPGIAKPKTARFGAAGPSGITFALLFAVAATVIFLSIHHGKKRVLTGRDMVVIADFDNSTGDPVFDLTLRQGLTIQLEQSPFLSLIPEDRIQQVLQQMQQPADAKLTSSVARELCERAAGAAVLDGSITPLGSQYVIGLRARDCQTGKVLANEQVQAARKEDVLQALDQIAGRFRTRLGESLSTVEKYDTPLAQVTTASLDALKSFSLAGKTMSKGSEIAALPFLSRAVELDPNFASAYLSMSSIYREHQEPGRAEEAIRKAYALRDKVSERERLWIEASYYSYGTGELEKAVSSLELLKNTYPRESGPHEFLGMIYRWLGEPEKALAEAKESEHLNPKNRNFQNLAADYVDLNRLDEAEGTYKAAEKHGSRFEGRAKSRYLLAFLQDNPVEMMQLTAQAKGQPKENAMLGAQADTEAWHGRLRNARELTRRAIGVAIEADEREAAGGHQAWMSLIESDMGEPELSRTDADAAMKLATTRDVQEMLALALARTGNTAKALKIADELDKAFPLDTLVQKLWLPVIRAAVALERNDPARAVEILQATSTIELANSVGVGCPSLRPIYLRGEAFLMLHDGKQAAAEFQKFIDHRGMVRNSPWGSLARLGLARAYVLQGDTAKASAMYRDFLAIWKDADQDNPVLHQAKNEYAKLLRIGSQVQKRANS